MLLIKKLLHERAIKQSELARTTGINESTISLIVNGRFYPYPVQKKKIALALNYDGKIEELFREVYDG